MARRWEALGVPVLQGYWTTEASPIVSCNSFRHRRLDSMGRPVPSVEVRLADDGEFLVRGPNITPGYWENPQAAHAAFLDGWYRTGDLGAVDRGAASCTSRAARRTSSCRPTGSMSIRTT